MGPTDEQIRVMARQQHGSSEVEVDHDAKVSRVSRPDKDSPGMEAGAWVAAWVWVDLSVEK